MGTTLLIAYLITIVNGCKIYIQLEPEKAVQLNDTIVDKGCEYEIYTTNQFSVNVECRIGGCLQGLHLRLSLEGYSLNPLAYNCQTIRNKTSVFQRTTIIPETNIDFECNFTAIKSLRSWGWSKTPKDMNDQGSNIFEFPFYVAQVFLPTKTIFCGGSISKHLFLYNTIRDNKKPHFSK